MKVFGIGDQAEFTYRPHALDRGERLNAGEGLHRQCLADTFSHAGLKFAGVSGFAPNDTAVIDSRGSAPAEDFPRVPAARHLVCSSR